MLVESELAAEPDDAEHVRQRAARILDEEPRSWALPVATSGLVEAARGCRMTRVVTS
jgi:hypothetical protein